MYKRPDSCVNEWTFLLLGDRSQANSSERTGSVAGKKRTPLGRKSAAAVRGVRTIVYSFRNSLNDNDVFTYTYSPTLSSSLGTELSRSLIGWAAGG